MREFEYNRPFRVGHTDSHLENHQDFEHVPFHLATRLGAGLETALNTHLTALIEPLRGDKYHHGDNIHATAVIQEAGMAITDLITRLKTSDETRIVRENGGFNFTFSGEKGEDYRIPDGMTTIPPLLTERVKGALSHNIGNKTSLFGYYKLLDSSPISEEEQEWHVDGIKEWLISLQQADAIHLTTRNNVTHFILPSHRRYTVEEIA